MSKECSCGEESNVGATVEFQCKRCSSIIERFEVKKPLKAAGVAALLAYGGSQFIDYAISDNRYPLSIEHEVMEACISNYQKPVSYYIHNKKRDICLCAMEDTMNEISYVRYKIDNEGFLSAFKDNVSSCRK